MRIRITKKHKDYNPNQIVDVSNNEAHGLLEAGVAEISKDMTQADFKTKGVKRGKSGR